MGRLRAMQRAAAQGGQQGALISWGLKRGMAKVLLFVACYTLAYAWTALTMWRAGRSGMHDS